MEKNYYEILGVSQNLSCAQIKSMCRRCLGTNLEEIYLVLTNVKSRTAYDRWLNKEEKVRYDYVSGEFYKAPTEEELECKQQSYNIMFLNEKVMKQLLHNERQIELEEVFNDPENQEILDRAEEEARLAEEAERCKEELANEIVKNVEEITKSNCSSLAVIEPDAVYERKRIFKSVKARIVAMTLAGAVLVGGIALSLRSCDKNNETPKDPYIDETPDATPSVNPEVTPSVNPEVTPSETPEVTPVVINPEEVTEINSENIDVMTNYFVEQASEKGLEVNAEEVRAALLVANMGSISKEEMEEMVPGLDMVAEYEKANNYLCAVNSHNIMNAIFGKDMNKYIALSSISYTETDANVLQSLDAYSVWLIECINRNILTAEEYQSSFKNITYFYAEIGNGLVVGDFQYDYDNLSAGGKYLAEAGIWPHFAMAYTLSDLATQESLDFIDSIEDRIIDGVEYLNEISSYGNEKTLVK